jgi:hypothetical protein
MRALVAEAEEQFDLLLPKYQVYRAASN